MCDERALIQTYFRPLAENYPGAFGLSDDGAVIACPAGQELVVTTDPLIEGVHFFPEEEPSALGWKALAVNVSDLVAMGARPLAYLLALAVPGEPDARWFSRFAGGLRDAQTAFGCQLAGGDTDKTPGPLTITITAFGAVPAGRAVRRSTASSGDKIFVSGTIGDAALGLALVRDPSLAHRSGLSEAQVEFLQQRWRRPRPPIAMTAALVDYRAAAADVSDGLLRDLERIADASGLGARVLADRVPVSDAAAVAVLAKAASLTDLFTGGEDYEIVAAVPAIQAEAFQMSVRNMGSSVTEIGELTGPGTGVVVLNSDGRPMPIARSGHDHFA